MRAFSKTLNSEICFSGIYSSEWTILKLVKEHEQISQTELIDYLGVEPAAISKTLTKLEKKHLIERRYLKSCRGKHIFLTDEGYRLYASLDSVVTFHRQRALEDFSVQECQQLFMFMRRIYQNVSG